MPENLRFFRFFRLQRKTKTDHFAATCVRRKFIVPRTGVRTPVTTSAPTKAQLLSEKENKRSSIRFHHRQKRMKRSLF